MKTLPGMMVIEGARGLGKSTARFDGVPLEPGGCPKCGQNGWIANSEDGALTVCDNCGWDVDAEGYIDGRG